MSAPAPTDRRPRTGARPRGRTARRRLPALAVALLTASPLATAATAGTAAPPGDPTRWDAPLPAGDQLLARTPVTVSLITGDRVRVEAGPEGLRAAPQPASRRPVALHRYERDGQVYAVPADAAPLVPHVLDRELFNVTKLAAYGYTRELPVIITAPAGRPLPRLEGAAGVSVTATLSSIDAVAATIDPTVWWPARTDAAAGWSGVGKVWLDEPARPVLEHSVPMIGAPEAWQAGLDGTGVTVAVLDSGVDADHPDLAGKVVAAANFTTEPDAGDSYGHGTHVAGIVAGSGAASQGRYVGTAPGARLINAKVCLATGSCPQSAIIAGMEWAAERADVLNLSLGTQFGSDGTDPMSQAVDALTAEHDVLFVVAAGNSGVLGAGSVGSPGAADAALTVGSVDTSGQVAPTSSRGPRLGDSAVKPDLTAPGVAIVSARAGGVPVPPGNEPVGEHYLRASGTSMATPHVAGAAAILLQQHPDLSAADLKAALVGTAVPADGPSVYEQGGGLVDIPAALDARLRVAPAPLNLGLLTWPDEQDAPVSRTVTYTNRTDRKLTVDLTLAVTGPAGLPHAPGALTVSPARLQLPPRATRQATVTLDPRVATPGVSGGYLVATASDGEVLARTPLGFEIEPERLGPGGWEQAQKLTPSTGEAEGAFGRAIAVDGDTALIGAAGNADGEVSRGAAYVLTRDATGRWEERARLVASDGGPWASFGASVALDGDTAVVGAITATVDGEVNRGAAYVFTRDGDTWTERARLVAADGGAGDNFGTAVAIHGDTILVGAPNARPDGVLGQGAVYVYTRSGDTWTQDQVLVASDGGQGAAFGYALTMAGDTALIGAPFATVDGNFLQGAVYEFAHGGGTWSQAARLVASDGGPFEGFGASLATDGDTVVVGAPAAPVAGTPLGAAYVLTRDGDGWVEQARLTADDTGRDGGEFGTAVAVEGGTVLAGTPWAMVGGNAVQGAVFVFTRSGDGWVRAARLTADDGASDDFLGGAVALSGGAAFAGAWLADMDDPECVPGDPSCGEQGAVYVFALSWALTADAYRDRGIWRADLSWSKPAGEVDVYRDGQHLARVDGGVASYRDVLGRGRPFTSVTYVVCHAGTTDCSDEVTVVLDPRSGARLPRGGATPV